MVMSLRLKWDAGKVRGEATPQNGEMWGSHGRVGISVHWVKRPR